MRALLIALSLGALSTAQAQTPLPYQTGFDGTAQQQGWQRFRTGFLSTYQWGWNSAQAHSAPTCLWHDYNVGGGAGDLVKDWSVSPALDLADGASLDLWANVYAIMGSTMPDDRLVVYLLEGSADPATATLTELADLTDRVTNTSAWTAVPTITVPPTEGTCHIGFYYQTTNNWFTPGIDDVSLVATGSGISALTAPTDAVVELYPNPVSDAVTVTLRDGRSTGEVLRLQVLDVRGALVMDRTFIAPATIPVSAGNGRYTYLVQDRTGTVVQTGPLLVGR